MESLLDQDQHFLRWQLETFPIKALVCNGRTTLDAMLRLLDATAVASGVVAGRRTWTIAMAEVGSRTMAIAGWNLPLAQAPRLTREAQVHLGAMLKNEMEQNGVDLS